jgi:hypothetical protein
LAHCLTVPDTILAIVPQRLTSPRQRPAATTWRSALAISNGLDAARRRLEDPTTWSLVERVAEALVIRRTLDADDSRTLVKRSARK